MIIHRSVCEAEHEDTV